ncbi:DUF1573 domain-containing protein [Pelagicoccus albus]|uniref:DUF1573 domain-containing protein n=1 Tax=Pelagicoccus albus TaxID=415222 RepID=A0A7X1B8B9_9BACT|nr:DUF1573 domain-containing protein [Pelagicoccus albus]MBC2607412.1 DUF1573 domain-containing protein [Pelagicoccus albus]
MKRRTHTNRTALFSKLLASLAALLIAPVVALAEGLQWETESLFFETEFGAEEVIAEYPFTNTGEQAIEIVNASSSCGCTVPTLDKRSYAPGESGTLKAIFTLGSRQGMQHKSITILTKTEGQDEEESHLLKLAVDIPIPVTFKPRVHFWKIGSEAKAKEIEVNIHEKMPFALSHLVRKDEEEESNFDYEIVTVEPNLKYLVRITPKTTERKSRDVYFLASEGEDGQVLRKYPIYAYVR